VVPLVVSGLLAISLLPGAGSAQIIPNTPQPAERDSAAFADTVAADTTAREVRLSAAADSVRQVLQALPGYTITEYTGDAANFRTDTGILRLEGNARVDQDGMQLTTDTLVYYQRDRLIETFGDSAYVHTNEQDLVGQRLIYDLTTRRATALQARTEVTESSATWIVTGDMTVEGTNRLLASHASFTSCDLLIPHYHFESDEVMVIRNRILVARPARFYIGEVPLFWLPFVVQNLEQGRRSGLLTPRFGINDIVRTSSGYNRQITNVGFYWAINDYMGAEVSTNWRSGAYTSLLGTLGFNWRRQFLSGNISAERYWPVSGARSRMSERRWHCPVVTRLRASSSGSRRMTRARPRRT
jgi:lipopolysaccharide assembly outer membrane protein LptD (OstA)